MWNRAFNWVLWVGVWVLAVVAVFVDFLLDRSFEPPAESA